MTGDELDRAIEFLLQSQASSDARLGRLEAAMAASQEKFDRQVQETNQLIEQNSRQIAALAEVAAQHSVQIEQNSAQLKHLMSVVAETVEAQRRNSQDIDALVKLVGGVIEGRNGGGGSDQSG